jgi:aryl-alcohol dehydrogenase-like predicted oxidoreductase
VSAEPVEGHASPDGTERYAGRFPDLAEAGHFRRLGRLTVSSIGLGTYLGEADDETDRAYEEAVVEALGSGINVVDTAINYRHQRSERAVGRALRRAIDEGRVQRDEVLVATKGGFLPFDGSLPEDPRGWLATEYLASGLVDPEELADGVHSLGVRFLEDQISRSRENLGVETIDLYFLHNPETQRSSVDSDGLDARLEKAFELLEEAAGEGAIARYGVASWKGLAEPAGSPRHLSLERIVAAAERAAGDWKPRLAAVELPFNLAMPHALLAPAQQLDGASVPVLVALRRLGLGAFVSASLLQGRLAAGALPADVADAFPDAASPAAKALQFARGAPGVTTALVGMASREHVEEAARVAALPTVGAETFRQLFG